MGFEGSWSGMRKYLEQNMLAPCLRGHIRYDCAAYPQANFSSRMFMLYADGRIVQRFCIEEACRWMIETKRIPGEMAKRWHAFWPLLAQTPPSARDAYTDDEFCIALRTYRQQDIRQSVRSEDPIVVMFALLDRRLGQRTWRTLPVTSHPAWVQELYRLRGRAESWSPDNLDDKETK